MRRLFDNTSSQSVVIGYRTVEEIAAPQIQPRGWYVSCRAVAEIVVVLILMVLTVPIIAVAAILVRLTSRGPALYTQTRLGQHGREYTIYKLRSMCVQSEVHSGPCWSSTRDPRVTRLGRILRRTHIDELPQLWNILRGDMSLIGPRPERPEFLAKLEKAVPRYRERLQVRPGVTGLAQVQLPPDSDVVDVRRKQAYDLYYIAEMSPWLDLRIILSTPLKICGVPYPVLRTVFAMPSPSEVEGAYLGPMSSISVEAAPVPQTQMV